jgi:hypothetical protein
MWIVPVVVALAMFLWALRLRAVSVRRIGPGWDAWRAAPLLGGPAQRVAAALFVPLAALSVSGVFPAWLGASIVCGFAAWCLPFLAEGAERWWLARASG